MTKAELQEALDGALKKIKRQASTQTSTPAVTAVAKVPLAGTQTTFRDQIAYIISEADYRRLGGIVE
tara:strand:+ start:378 stop:578 length:201 start_codon:yes stop_codon:yes gene_type:complete